MCTSREHSQFWDSSRPLRERRSPSGPCAPLPQYRAMSRTRYHCDMTDFRWSENAGSVAERRRAGSSMVMRVIVTGLVGQYAFGGVAWDYLQYVEGFRQLGHDVFYLEDTETWPYDPISNTVTDDCSYNVSYLREVMARLDLADRWIYRNCPDGRYYGVDVADARQICASADLFVNVSGSAWLRPEYRAIPRRIFIDSDPMFTQIGLLSANAESSSECAPTTGTSASPRTSGSPIAAFPQPASTGSP